MRAWTFKRKINAAQLLAAFLASTEMAGPPSAGGSNQADWSKTLDPGEYSTESKPSEDGKDSSSKSKAKGKGDGTESRRSDGSSFHEPGEGEEQAEMDGEEATAIDSWQQPITKEIVDTYKKAMHWHPPKYSLTPTKWGKMEIEQLPLERKKNTKGSQAVAEGVMLRYPHRYATDMSLFKRSRGHLWGSLLIDFSGSMGLSTEEVHEFIKAVPAANIGVYTANSIRGGLRIIAQKGLVASDERLAALRSYTGNQVDGPALRWLATQPKPRIWVSDGLVTGEGDQLALELLQEAANICKANKILRVGSMAKALELVRSGRGGVHA